MQTIHSSAHRVAIVTGASRGIGAAIARELAGQSFKVFNLDRDAPTSESAAEHVPVDLRDTEQLTNALFRITQANAVTCLVNNAAVGGPLWLEEVNATAFDLLVNVNLRASMLCAQAVLPAMKQAHWGRIVNITSRAALGKEGRTIYGATKAGLISMTRTWALELGAHGITVNAVGPGPINTELFANSNPPDSPRTQAIIDGIPVKRIGTPEDVAKAVGFFTADSSSFVTGQVLYVCGGLTVGYAST